MTKTYDNFQNLKAYVQRIHCFYKQKPEKVPHGFQAIVTDGQNDVTVTLYETGTILIQGKKSELKDALEGWKRGDKKIVYKKPATPRILPAQSTEKQVHMIPDLSTLTREMMQVIRIDYNKGASCEELAQRYRVQPSLIEYIVSAKK